MIHISNLYNAKMAGESFETQQYIANCGKELGFNELGLFTYMVESDTENELSKRLDGAIGAVSGGDTIILQFPTGNGANYERILMAKIRGNIDCRMIVVLQEASAYESLHWMFCDLLVSPNENIYNEAKQKGINADNYLISGMSKNVNNVIIKRNLLEAVAVVDMHTKMEPKPNIDYIHVGFGLHDRTGEYSSYVGTVMETILRHTDAAIWFHIFCDESVSRKNKDLLCLVGANYGAIVEFHLVNPQDITFENEFLHLYSIGSLFRLLMPRMLPQLNRLIYLDADLMVMRDIKELWNVDLQENSVAAVHDIGFENGITSPDIIKDGTIRVDEYFNSGVLLMDLVKIRKKGDLLELSLEYLNNHPDSVLPDQDALNYIFRNDTLLLDSSWNCFTRYERRINDRIVNNRIYHYMGQPCISYHSPTEYDKKYMEYRKQTPWGYNLVERDIFRGIYSLSNKFALLQKLLSSVAGLKMSKIYFGKHSIGMNSILEIIPPQKGDFGICAIEDKNRMELYGMPLKNIDALKSVDKEKYIILVLPDAAGGSAVSILESNGFIAGINFFIIPWLLTDEQGGYWS